MAKALVPEKKLAILEDIISGKLTGDAIADKHGTHKSTVYRLSTEAKHRRRGVTLKQLAGLPVDAVSTNGVSTRNSKWGHLKPEILKLRAQELTVPEIAERLGMPSTAVHYYIYAPQQKAHSNGGHVGNGNGNGTAVGNGAFNKNVALGFAYAETERFIGNLAPRLGFTPEHLRSRLSELLGHSPFRSQRGAGDPVPGVQPEAAN